MATTLQEPNKPLANKERRFELCISSFIRSNKTMHEFALKKTKTMSRVLNKKYRIATSIAFRTQIRSALNMMVLFSSFAAYKSLQLRMQQVKHWYARVWLTCSLGDICYPIAPVVAVTQLVHRFHWQAKPIGRSFHARLNFRAVRVVP